MPQLTKKAAQTASTAAETWQDTQFELLDPGWYLFRLVSVTEKQGKAGPYWEWKFAEVHSENFVWDNTSLSEKAIGRLGKLFEEGFGVDPETDTDDLIGQLVNVEIVQKPRQAGERAGEMRNEPKSYALAVTHPEYSDFVDDPGPQESDFGTETPEPDPEPEPPAAPRKPKPKPAGPPPTEPSYSGDEEPF